MTTIEQMSEDLGIDKEDVLEFLSVFVDYTENEDLPGLKSALENRDVSTVRKRAHSIKGAALNLQLNEVASLAERIEKTAAANSLEGVEAMYTDIQEQINAVRLLLP
ncbi:MAG: Hpt domain-containing protein [Syntrophaceae bacterium]|nr:Hpt domain-containing protein [Syntrophaceae bacterium]